jgi:hypothetical protein
VWQTGAVPEKPSRSKSVTYANTALKTAKLRLENAAKSPENRLPNLSPFYGALSGRKVSGSRHSPIGSISELGKFGLVTRFV